MDKELPAYRNSNPNKCRATYLNRANLWLIRSLLYQNNFQTCIRPVVRKIRLWHSFPGTSTPQHIFMHLPSALVCCLPIYYVNFHASLFKLFVSPSELLRQAGTLDLSQNTPQIAKFGTYSSNKAATTTCRVFPGCSAHSSIWIRMSSLAPCTKKQMASYTNLWR